MFLEFSNVRIAGIAAAVPKKTQEIINSDYGAEEDRIKFSKTTGVISRRLSSSDQCTSDFCFAAAEKLIKDLGWNKKDIEVLIFVTQTPDYILPSTAIVLQERLGLPTSCAAFDVNLGCSGYPYGLSMVASFLSAMVGKKGLLLVGDTSSKGVLPSTVATIPPLFGDCGTATALEWKENRHPIYSALENDGRGCETIMHKYGMYRYPFKPGNFKAEINEYGNIELDTGFVLDGLEVFNFSVREVPKAVKGLLDKFNLKQDDLDCFVFHQANKLMNEIIRKSLKIPAEKHPYTLGKYGNTSSATIPLTLVSEMREQVTSGVLNTLMCGFGVGLSWGTLVTKLDHIICPEVIEL